MGGRTIELVERPPSDEDWYLNLFWLHRRKCLLFVHAGTLFAGFIPDARKAQITPPGQLLADAVSTELRAEGLPPDTFGPLDPASVVLAKTASRRVLGFMNDRVAQIDDYANLRHLGSAEINARVRQTPYGRGEYLSAIDRVAKRLHSIP